MAKYTITIRKLKENNFDFGLKDYPIFDENYRKQLNDKILKHYYFREIGFETAELFKLYLNQTLSEIMPYYNELYKTTLFEFNPLENYKISESVNKTGNKNDDYSGTTTDNRTESGNSERSDNSESTETTENSKSGENTSVFSDTPQGMLTIGNIKGNTYASQAEISESSETGTGTTTGSETSGGTAEFSTESQNVNTAESLNKQDYAEIVIKTVSGNKGENYSKMLLEFRKTLLNIDMMIINELKNLFMMIY